MMRINVKEALMIADKYDFEVPILYLSDLQIKSGDSVVTIPKETSFDPSHYEYLDRAGICAIDVQYNDKLHAQACIKFSCPLQAPLRKEKCNRTRQEIDKLEAANGTSKRKRHIVSLTEYYKKQPWGAYEIILKYGESLNYKRWNEVKANLNRTASIDYRFDECGIIVFFILNVSDPNYSQNFMKFTELVSLIVDSKRMGVIFSPDFVPETDVYTVNTKSDLLKCYTETGVTLIIVGEDLNDQYKDALSQVKFYDKYARFMVIKHPDPSHRVEILTQIKNVYGSRLWEEK